MASRSPLAARLFCSHFLSPPRGPSPPSASRVASRRSHSSWVWGEEGADQDIETTPLGKRLNQVYEEYRSQKLAPSWLPLQPTASYWIPPSPPLTEMLKLSPHRGKQLSNEEMLSLLTSSCWASGDPKESRKSGSQSLAPELEKAILELQEAASWQQVKDDKTKA